MSNGACRASGPRTRGGGRPCVLETVCGGRDVEADVLLGSTVVAGAETIDRRGLGNKREAEWGRWWLLGFDEVVETIDY